MVTKNCIVTSLCILSVGTTLHGVVAQYTKEDKKIFDSLTDVSFTKSSLATKARKEKRVEDLMQLATHMTRRLVNIMDGSGLKKEYNTPSMLKIVGSALTDATGKKELLAANRFAVYEFEKNFENNMEKLFQDKLKDLKGRSDDIARELKITLAAIMTKIPKSVPLTLLSFEDAAQKLRMAQQPILQDQIIKVKRVLRPTQEETIDILKKSLDYFNVNYKKIISALKQLPLSFKLELPDSISLGYIQSFGKK